MRITLDAGIEELVAIVSNVNDRLHHPRIAERTVIGERPEELARLRSLYAARRYARLRQALRQYHMLRLGKLAAIHRELMLLQLSGDV
ncbi:MAG: hypothetical protein DIU71_13890 [Proteobacteria bacterium]|nr:MAG: hypothetical protein DIU71_13890 [Pseudomonadota bacterium]